MGNYNRDDRGGDRGGGYRGRSSFGGGSRGGFRGGRPSFGGGRSFDRGGDRGGDRGSREMYKATCDNCGKECEVPFKPTSGKPVYCSDCFEKMGGRNSDRPQRSEFRSEAPRVDINKAQIEAMNAKLDKILKLLEPNKPASVESVVEVKAPKVKKAKKEVKE